MSKIWSHIFDILADLFMPPKVLVPVPIKKPRDQKSSNRNNR